MHPRQILDGLGIRARKSFSQNFLTSEHWAEKIARALDTQQSDAIWEIGPGLGAITEKLIALGKPITIFELDRALVAYLKERFSHVPIVEGDFLEAELEPHFPQKGKVAVVSNLPYHISTPVLFRLLDHKEKLSCWVLTFQRELARRLVAKPHTKAYGALSVLMQSQFTISSLGTLHPGAFYPSPSVQSEALLCVPRSGAVDRPALARVLKAAFSHRRKLAKKNLKEHFVADTVEQCFTMLELGEQVRAEEISVGKFEQMAGFLKPKVLGRGHASLSV